jgi:hypothetical protein
MSSGNSELHHERGKSVEIKTEWRNDNPNTIWNRLADRLGRQPTYAEAAAEVCRILREEAEENSDA